MSTTDRTPAHVRKRRVEREAKLKKLGYMTYPAYLRSSHWARKRAQYQAAEHLPQTCVLCEDPDVQLHHKTYERIGQEELTDLEPLCRRCHAALHALERRGDTTLDPAGLKDEERAEIYQAERAPAVAEAVKDFKVTRGDPWMKTWMADLDEHLAKLVVYGEQFNEDLEHYAEQIRKRVRACERRLERRRPRHPLGISIPVDIELRIPRRPTRPMKHYPPRQTPSTAGHWTPTRNRVTQARFRRQVLKAAGHQCQAMQAGIRCPATTNLQAHHTQPGNDDPTTGVCLCRPHHRIIDPHAR